MTFYNTNKFHIVQNILDSETSEASKNAKFGLFASDSYSKQVLKKP